MILILIVLLYYTDIRILRHGMHAPIRGAAHDGASAGARVLRQGLALPGALQQPCAGKSRG